MRRCRARNPSFRFAWQLHRPIPGAVGLPLSPIPCARGLGSTRSLAHTTPPRLACVAARPPATTKRVAYARPRSTLPLHGNPIHRVPFDWWVGRPSSWSRAIGRMPRSPKKIGECEPLAGGVQAQAVSPFLAARTLQFSVAARSTGPPVICDAPRMVRRPRPGSGPPHSALVSLRSGPSLLLAWRFCLGVSIHGVSYPGGGDYSHAANPKAAADGLDGCGRSGINARGLWPHEDSFSFGAARRPTCARPGPRLKTS